MNATKPDYAVLHERVVAAHHEAGHAVGAILLRIGIDRVTISRSNLTPGTQSGFVRFRARMGTLDARQIAVSHLMGELAERACRRSGEAPLAKTDQWFTQTAVMMTGGDPVAVEGRYRTMAAAWLTLHKDWIHAVANALLKADLSEADVMALRPGAPREEDR